MRTNKETYIAVQSIYYPSFTIGGLREGVGMLAALGLLLMTPAKTTAFWTDRADSNAGCLLARYASR
jgi:predicted ribosomally synthesized peptide with SipW-like signal peptide